MCKTLALIFNFKVYTFLKKILTKGVHQLLHKFEFPDLNFPSEYYEYENISDFCLLKSIPLRVIFWCRIKCII